jgi:protein gp37
MASAEIQFLPMSKAEARRKTERIRGHFDAARRLIYEMHEREGWKALGYRDWLAYVRGEFDEARSTVERQRCAGEIEVLLSPNGDKEVLIGKISEGQLRPLARFIDDPDRLRAAWALALKNGKGKPTGQLVAEAVAEIEAHYEPSGTDQGTGAGAPGGDGADEAGTTIVGASDGEKAGGQGDAPEGADRSQGNGTSALDGSPRPGARSKATFNRTTDLVDWAEWTWNPVAGCLHDCPYCYARDIANRHYEEKFAPTFHRDRLPAPWNTPFPDLGRVADPVRRMAKKNVFVCSMADLFGPWVRDGWIEAVFESCRRWPQWNYLFLTKFPDRYEGLKLPPTAWVGTTVDEQERVANAEKAFQKIQAPVKWLSVEPMREKLTFTRLDLFDWVVIGGQSRSSQAPEFHPPFDWVADLWHAAKAAGCAVYCKPNTWPGADGWLPKEYPKAMMG